jgi:hypothetical protein
MSALTLIRILRDTLGLVVAMGFVLTTAIICGLIDAYRTETDWDFGGQNPALVTIVVTASLAAFTAWFFVQRKEKMLASRGLTTRRS